MELNVFEDTFYVILCNFQKENVTRTNWIPFFYLFSLILDITLEILFYVD